MVETLSLLLRRAQRTRRPARPVLDRARARQTLGLKSRQALASRVSNGSVLALKSADGAVLYPVSQFHRRSDGTAEVKPALVAFLRTLRAFDPWAVGVLLHTPAPELGGLTPMGWARQDRDPDTLADLAHAVAREWSAGVAVLRHSHLRRVGLAVPDAPPEIGTIFSFAATRPVIRGLGRLFFGVRPVPVEMPA